jgi:hypothetical protein
MSDDDRLPSLENLRDQFTEAAVREHSRRRRRPRGVRRIGLFVAVAGLVVASGAGAGKLLGIGEPTTDQRDLPGKLRPAGARRVVLRVHDAQAKTDWGAAVYTAVDGKNCVLAGVMRAASIGVMSSGTFHPYGPDYIGVCARLATQPLFYAAVNVREPAPRTLVYGLARPGIRRLSVITPDERREVEPGPGGAFLLLFDGVDLKQPEIQVRPLHE